MFKILALFILVAAYPFVLRAAGAKGSDTSSADRIRSSQLEKASAVPVDETRKMFRDAAAEFRVPRVLLEAIGYVENNWTQVGPSLDKGWGIMHLVENDYCDTLGEAARLLKTDRQVLKDDPRQNIRGAAALLASYAMNASTASLKDWFRPASRFSGLISRELRDRQAYNYFSVISKGVSENDAFNRRIEIPAQAVDLAGLGTDAAEGAEPLSPPPSRTRGGKPPAGYPKREPGGAEKAE